MDGVEKLKDVTIIAATNRPDMIDKVNSGIMIQNIYFTDDALLGRTSPSNAYMAWHQGISLI
jgi:ATP-dependent 26S proteasome regulatory subunit